MHTFSVSLVEKAVSDGRITKDDADLIRTYLTGSYMGDFSTASRYNIFYILVSFRQYFGEYRHNTIEDLFGGVTQYKESNRRLVTKVHQLAVLKQFYEWLIDRGESSIPRHLISHGIKVKGPERDFDSALTHDDVFKLIETCKNSRDRAFIAFLYESGIRTKDACELRWGDLTLDRNGIVLAGNENISQNPRPCIFSTGFLMIWKNDYPGETSADNFVFVTREGHPITVQQAVRLLGRIVKRSGISKYVHLRSINNDESLRNKMTYAGDQLIKKKLWEIRSI